MVYLQYQGPSDTFDASNLLGKPDQVFNTPSATHVPQDQRGNVIKVTNEKAEELLSYPNHRFVEVEEDAAKALIEAQDAARKNREGFAQLQAQHETPILSRATISNQIGALTASTGPEIAPSAPRVSTRTAAPATSNVTAPAGATSAETGGTPGAAPVSTGRTGAASTAATSSGTVGE